MTEEIDKQQAQLEAEERRRNAAATLAETIATLESYAEQMRQQGLNASADRLTQLAEQLATQRAGVLAGTQAFG